SVRTSGDTICDVCEPPRPWAVADDAFRTAITMVITTRFMSTSGGRMVSITRNRSNHIQAARRSWLHRRRDCGTGAAGGKHISRGMRVASLATVLKITPKDCNV